MSYRLDLDTPEDRDLVVEALRTAARQRSRVATSAAMATVTDAATRDIRSQAVKVVRMLAEAGDLTSLADDLADAEPVQDLKLITYAQDVDANLAARDAEVAAILTDALRAQLTGTAPPLEADVDVDASIGASLRDSGLMKRADANTPAGDPLEGLLPGETPLANVTLADLPPGAGPDDLPPEVALADTAHRLEQQEQQP